MNNAINNDIFYVSNLGADKVSIIDGESLSIIDEVKVGSRPYEIDVDTKNNIYIATDRNNKIAVINNNTKEKKNLYIPNNGHVKVDSISNKLYVSNIEEIYIYSLDENIIINKINGFLVVDSIELNSDCSKLFVLDILKNEIKIYDTVSLKLIKIYKNICQTPNSFFIGNEERNLYIVNKGIYKLDLDGGIVKINLNNDEVSYISFERGSIITSITGDSKFLYCINYGLKRIEIIDILKECIYISLKVSLKYPQKIKVLEDSKLLLVTSKDDIGNGALDVIDIDNKKIVNTLKFNEKYLVPYSIGIIKNIKFKELNIENNIDNKNIKNNYILANKVLSTYEERIIFKEEKVELVYEDTVYIEAITFENCQVIEESKKKEFIVDNEDYIVLNFEFIIPYYIKCINFKKEKIIIRGNLTGKEKAVVYINKNESDNLEFIIKSDTKSMYFPYIKGKYIVFDAISTISTYVAKEELILIPSIGEL